MCITRTYSNVFCSSSVVSKQQPHRADTYTKLAQAAAAFTGWLLVKQSVDNTDYTATTAVQTTAQLNYATFAPTGDKDKSYKAASNFNMQGQEEAFRWCGTNLEIKALQWCRGRSVFLETVSICYLLSGSFCDLPWFYLWKKSAPHQKVSLAEWWRAMTE